MPEYQLRPKQIEDLTFAICEKKSLNTSHPATGKSGTVSVLAYYHWEKRGKKTVYAMPQSLMPNNRTKMLQFTDFKPEDVVILGSDHAEYQELDRSHQDPAEEGSQHAGSGSGSSRQ
jgi:hypothetical protein